MQRTALSSLGRRTAAPPISWLMEQTLRRPRLISLAAGFTDSATLPVADARALCRELFAKLTTGRAALQYGTTAGDPTLRQLTAERLGQMDWGLADRSVYAPERVLITHGSQQLLYLVTEALCDPGDIVLVEDPTYFVYLGIVQSRGLRARGIRLTANGLDLDALARVLASLRRSGELPRLKMMYLVSYHQNPTGVTTRFSQKQGVLRLLRACERAAGHPIYLVEDAAYRELRFAGAPERSALAAGADAAERVIYAGTYSKPFATGARVGFGLLPKPIFTVVLRLKGNHDFGTANLLQKLLARALASGRYVAHLAVLRRRYAAKARIMAAAMREHFPPQADVWSAEGGLYYWVRLPRKCKTGLRSKLFQHALRENVLYVPGALCYADDPTRPKSNHEMRLSFGGAKDAEIRAGIERLGAALRVTFEQ